MTTVESKKREQAISKWRTEPLSIFEVTNDRDNIITEHYLAPKYRHLGLTGWYWKRFAGSAYGPYASEQEARVVAAREGERPLIVDLTNVCRTAMHALQDVYGALSDRDKQKTFNAAQRCRFIIDRVEQKGYTDGKKGGAV